MPTLSSFTARHIAPVLRPEIQEKENEEKRLEILEKERVRFDGQRRKSSAHTSTDSWKKLSNCRLLTVLISHLALHIIPKHFSHIILPDDNFFSFSSIIQLLSWFLLPLSFLEKIGNDQDHSILNIITKWTSSISSLCFMLFLKASMDYSKAINTEICCLASAILGVCIWSSPITVDDISLQFIASGILFIKIIQLGLDLQEWIPVLIFPALETFYKLRQGTATTSAGRSEYSVPSITYTCVQNLVIGVVIAFVVPYDWRVVIFFIADAFSAFDMCQLWD